MCNACVVVTAAVALALAETTIVRQAQKIEALERRVVELEGEVTQLRADASVETTTALRGVHPHSMHIHPIITLPLRRVACRVPTHPHHS